jgi:putative tricarboxylic transport membrane protein
VQSETSDAPSGAVHNATAVVTPPEKSPLIVGQLLLSLGVLLIGALILTGSFGIPDAAGYSTVGPREVPRLVGIGLIALGALLVWEVVRGGFRNHDEASEAALKTDWAAFAWVSAGLLLYGLTIERAGFVIASILLFVCTARSFNSRRWVSNTLISLVLAFGAFAIFNYGLGLNLPKGILRGVL